MSKVRVLDCTLRDGGYINEWNFGLENVKKVVKSLNDARIEIIEIGFLSNRIEKNDELSKFVNILDISDILNREDNNSIHVCMINFGEYNLEDLPEAKSNLIDGIRVAFHKKDMYEAIELCKGIKEKGYKIFMQPMVAANYSDLEYLKLIELSNEVKPYAFYVVDSFGVMKENDVIKYFFMADYNLDKEIYVGFHSHNNLQLSYANAIALLKVNTQRELIIDSSIHGMGRGAGNLNTELFVEYLNDLHNRDYNVKPLLEVIDTIIKPIYHEKKWGYSLPHYLSAVNNCHPNYASYLDDRNTLTIQDISLILGDLDPVKKNNFDREYIRSKYITYLEKSSAKRNDIEKLKLIFKNKTILILAPGKSILYSENIIKNYINENVITIAVNFVPNNINCDYVFFSNKKRFDHFTLNKGTKIIATSNIENGEKTDYLVDYHYLLNTVSAVEDNSGLMLLKLLFEIGVNNVFLAGFDGYSYQEHFEQNYVSKKMSFVQSEDRINRINLGMNFLINEYAKKIDITMITEPKHIHIYYKK
ncbi:MAG: aldolase catalytic domain-containing protein [Tenericutes bacterium]|nr:aldolase catalytic domain-containing protein [Mycoplasmatota bacterium]